MSRWDNPLRDLMLLQERMNRLFDESLQHGRLPDEDAVGAYWQPAVDIFETHDEIVLKVEIPGIGRDDIAVDVDQNRLTIRGERRLAQDVERERYHQIERSYGAFSRSFDLPYSVDQENITAEYRLGVLTVRMPKRTNGEPRQVTISIG
jgi:HSP20 family protein